MLNSQNSISKNLHKTNIGIKFQTALQKAKDKSNEGKQNRLIENYANYFVGKFMNMTNLLQ